MHTPRARAVVSLIAAFTLALALGACGGDDDSLSQADREKASAAALDYVGGGTVTDVERGDGDDDFAYEVEVTLPNDTDIDVRLNDDFKVINNPPKAADFASTATPTAPTTSSPGAAPSDDDAPLTGETLARASAAALKATGGGKVIETSGSDDPDYAYEVEVLLPTDEQVTVELDSSFKVVEIDR